MKENYGTLYLVATPIGNLEDITYRAVRILSEVDLIAAEDTRHSLKLLNHLGIKKPLISYHDNNRISRAKELAKKLKEGKNIALVSDAGGLPENVTDGVDGWIVPARDIPAMTAKLRFMLDNPEAVRLMGHKARETSLRDFNLERFAAATVDVYQRTLAGR